MPLDQYYHQLLRAELHHPSNKHASEAVLILNEIHLDNVLFLMMFYFLQCFISYIGFSL